MSSSPTAGLLVPPKSIAPLPGKFEFSRSVVLASPSAGDALPLGQLAADLRRRGVAARVQRSAVGQAVVRVHRDQKLPHEHYRVAIDGGGVSIFAGDDAGAYYAVQTIRELFCAGEGRELRCCRVEDRPDFARRGVYHDCSRGKVPTLETLKELVERLATWKINELQLYVENVFSFRRHPQIGRGYSPFTAAELLELGDWCKLHHVRLVGSLASFGHLERILELPAYRHLGEMPYSPGRACMTLCPGDAGSLKLIRELYEEFVPLFEPRDFNICCDETWELGKGRSKARVARLGVGRVYMEFLLKLHGLVQGYGKRTNAWADIVLEHPELLKYLPRDMVMLNWDYNANPPGKGRTARASEIARAGLPFMVCPGTSAWMTHGTRLENAVGNVRQASEEGLKNKAEGLLNTDWGDSGHRNFLAVSLHGFAHAAACSWNSRAVDDCAFTRTFCRQVFAQQGGRLAGAVAALGSSYKIVSDEYYNRSQLYFTLVEPVRAKEDKGAIDQCKPAGLRRIIDALGARSLWPSAPAGLPRFEALAMQEFAVAARMEVLAARRALVVQALRAGKASPSRERKTLAADIRAVARDLARLWMARNKPSRLKDNLRQLNRAADELIA